MCFAKFSCVRRESKGKISKTQQQHSWQVFLLLMFHLNFFQRDFFSLFFLTFSHIYKECCVWQCMAVEYLSVYVVHSGAVVSAVASLRKKSWVWIRDRMCFCVEFACSPWACLGFLQELWFPPRSPKTCKLGFRLIGSSKWPLGVNECGWLFVSVVNRRHVQGVPCFHSKMQT